MPSLVRPCLRKEIPNDNTYRIRRPSVSPRPQGTASITVVILIALQSVTIARMFALVELAAGRALTRCAGERNWLSPKYTCAQGRHLLEMAYPK
ncbi:hypothetical protein DAEQUDRAFT_726282 [Daedalea quercina L-15889]|uniref:Uncharacterized protein n=1 Tax=Daedalea quercina L-15889 TaxID=1314783 RepID=A0A165QM25_9APHY|nr:hypothetical protein DAEQUDRAFT_726282 [Daedalea quercina L-15889]